MIKNLICISCPVGCALTVKMENNEVVKVEGQRCKRGEIYAGKECVNPTRIFTSSIPVTCGYPEMLSVKTKTDIPKDKISSCILALKGIKIDIPVRIGDVIIQNIADTGVYLIATRSVAHNRNSVVQP